MLVRPAPLRTSRAAAVAVALFLAWSLWVSASLAWSLAPPQTALEVERNLVYLGFVGILMLLVRGRAPAATVIVAVVVAISGVVIVALAGYLLRPVAPDPTQGRLLFEPLGYANALGGLAAIGLPLLVAASGGGSALASAATVPVATALYLSQSRSAWLAVACALGFWATRTMPRPRVGALVSMSLFPAAAVMAVGALGLVSPSLPDAARDPRCALAAAIVLACAGGAALLGARRVTPPQATAASSPGAGLVLGCALCLGALLAVVRGGAGDRPEYWRVAWRMFVAHPLAGSGGGSFAVEWVRLRSVAVSTKDAHSLYLETLGETGIVGVLLLVGALAVPLVVARHRRSSLDVAALAGYGAFLIHAAFEWDWEMPAVTLTGLALAAALLATDADHEASVSLGAGSRAIAALACLCAAGFVAVSALGHTYVTRAERLAASGDVLAADAEARRAATVLPWASEPLLVRGDLRLHGGDAGDARAFYLRALKRDHANWQIWLRLGVASSSRAAADARRRAFELDPGVARGSP
jgi:hypothetical protein